MCFLPSNDFACSFCRRCFGGFGVRFVFHDYYPLFMPKKAVDVRTKPFRSEHRPYTPRKTFCKRFFSKKAQKVLREISRKTFTFGTLPAYTTIPPFKRETISSYSSLFIRFTGRSSTSLNSTYPEQSEICTHKLLFNNLLFMF